MSILLLQDYRHSAEVLRRALARSVGPILSVDAADIRQGVLSTATTLIMPGGGDRFFAEHLAGQGNDYIRAFVADGGTFIGICGGAYYGCQNIDWRDGEISAPRELGFFKGTATGPIPQFCHNRATSTATRVTGPMGTHLVYYWGGPLFNGDFTNVDILARYTDLPQNPPAIISSQLGKGRWVLSSPHPEYDSHAILASLSADDDDADEKRQAAAALATAPATLWEAFLTLIPTPTA